MTGARAQVARLLALAPYLQSRTGVPLAQVAADFGVRPEQIVKDLRVLWMCGLPGLTPDKMIEVDFESFEDDPEGLVRIGNAEFLSRPIRLGSSEASALIVALRALRESGGAAAGEVIERALAKLEDAAQSGTPGHVEVHLPVAGAAEAVAAELRQAVAADRQVRLDYYVPARDETTDRVVDPLAVLVTGGHSYLDAWCHVAQARRLFRVDRMHRVEVLESARTQHTDLAPRDLSEGLFETAPDDLTAVLHVSARARWVADYYPVESTSELDGGGLEVVLRVGDPRWLVRLALRLAGDAELVSPADLRAEVIGNARSTLELYTDRVS